ncbi:MAG: type II secretion system F family protein [Syntrophobacterales bacterium CG_4_8_14_3_um_filter_58_8]|nr:MAG: general secretion pathway protein GspF [Syntrophaceae bacterium CG2_30_58_14]PIV07105.1 MAG: type II secretion system F family protein [Syntrophobacterales bacterium CG03_land_8_20_14_0_80_58_14]PJC71637.1 MAG: type II secretion system F family protein [Syntrophobacterales bacterium CG_4_8_14_3_um_filter_58_8]
MTNFSYEAINESGMSVNGTIEADSVEMAENLLLAKGYIPTRVSAAAASRTGGVSVFSRIQERLSTVKIGDLILFTKQFRSMMKAGVPIIRLLQVLENQTGNKILKGVIAQMSQDIKAGLTLYESMKRHPAIFSPLYLSMVNAGEISGVVPDILARLIDIIEHEAKIKSDIKSALQYPFIVVIALGIAFFVLLTFVIPKFAIIFTKAGLTLPLPTKIAMLMYQLLANYWYLLIGGAVVLIIALRLYLKTPPGRYAKDLFILKLPLFGPLFQKAAMSRFASIFAILQASGVPVMQAMEVLSGTIGNAAISGEFDKVRERIREGQGIAGPLGAAKFFTPMVVDMVAIGEESGNIEDMLHQVALHYDDEVNYAVKSLSDMIGPILIVGLAAVVGFFAMAIFLPMWDLTKMTK